MDRWQSILGPDEGMLEMVATCIAGWLAVSAARADLEFIRQSLGLLFNF